jgi:hypothetical protein
MRQLIVFLVGVFFSVSALAAIRILDIKVTPSASGENSATLQFVILPTGVAKLTGVSSPIAESSELQRVTQEKGVMNAQAIDSIGLIPGRAYNMVPSGTRVMLHNLKQPLKPGDEVPFTLTFEVRNGTQTLDQIAKIPVPGAEHGNKKGLRKAPGM